MEDLLAHEFYHARINFTNEMHEKINIMAMTNENCLEVITSYILEEGIATLLQKEDRESASFVTKQDFENVNKYFAELDKIIKNIIFNDKPTKELFSFIGPPIYVVGYYVAKTLYDHGGKETLNLWTTQFDYKRCIKIFIETTRAKDNTLRFSKEVEELLLSM